MIETILALLAFGIAAGVFFQGGMVYVPWRKKNGWTTRSEDGGLIHHTSDAVGATRRLTAEEEKVWVAKYHAEVVVPRLKYYGGGTFFAGLGLMALISLLF